MKNSINVALNICAGAAILLSPLLFTYNALYLVGILIGAVVLIGITNLKLF